VVEYESLIQGLLLAQKRGIQALRVYGDSELVVNQVRNQNTTKNGLLKSYKHRVWDLLEGFNAFNIQSIPRKEIRHADRLAEIGASYDVLGNLEEEKKQQIKVVVRPAIPDNNIHWQVFESDEQIVSFLKNEAEFSDRNHSRLRDQYGDQIINLSSNKLPKGLITLESVFNPDDQARGRGMNLAAKKDDHIPVTIANGKSLNMGKVCSEIEQESFIHLCQEFNDVFSWTFDDLKAFDPRLFQHTIDLIENVKPVRQKQRPVYPKIEPLMRKELSKLIEANKILPIKHSSWVANLVPVRKKNGEIRLYVDLRDLNQASLKDHHPLPSMEQILSKVNGSKRFSFLDGFSGYNQVLVKESDRYKTTFTTKWGTYAYFKMPFELTNAGATFQKAMEMAFKKMIDKFVLVYLDDIIVYSKNVEDHFDHLR
jgi:hypothetical protein